MNRINSFPPIVDQDSEILILGSVPGAKSLEMKQYYAFPQNQFWRILFHLFDSEFSEDYETRINLLKQNKIALWDVIESCERKGSLDTEIKDEIDNNIPELIDNHPNIQTIFCNGQKSYKNLVKILGKDFKIPIVVLPSTSPLHTVKFGEKLLSWEQIKTQL
ncbi:DNA-deoxyinosine glycosylase [Epilithonimonas ginsengisoli]|uniref:DNA-deoxyinosine glycosylase n=1 Tax=Epilithonimonas ginsengisoli TaxID=1245592 RepID=A0ABU4JIS9_9FLAO|nr:MULTISPECIES: DNA-deoxyinosine glycosylase [Chryseobacterium group]MBV6878864.1 DNA-deoxyinosine glycosylase [Epilithonimonas sp. FP105]MDW8549468.1 DNA-deoxyinosine glycosylase [Epilithonimonas ginsengisoli]OAH71655.1 DNA-deoxyinosine glycosylase [Chryseobacterium sp. FP211-J200]